MGFFINWNTVPMTFNDSWTYLEMLGKCVTQIDINARNIETNRQNIEINRQNIETNRQNIETNRQNIEANKQRIDALDEDLHTNYFTKEECNKMFLTIENSYTKEQIDAKLADYATIEDLNSAEEEIAKNYATKDEVASVDRDLTALETRLIQSGGVKYFPFKSLSATIEDNIVNFSIPTAEFSGITANVAYVVTSGSTQYTANESIHIKPLKIGKRFVMYSMTLGGFIELQNISERNFKLIISKPSGTETVAISDVSVEVFKSSREATQEQKQLWYDKADCSGDGLIDASDASMASAYYAWVSTLDPTTTEEIKNMTLDEKFIYFCEHNGYANHGQHAPDVNLDGRVDSVDVGLINSFYAYISTGGQGGVDGWYNWITETLDY